MIYQPEWPGAKNDPLPVGLCEEFIKLFKTEDQRPNGQDVYEEIFASAYMFPLQRREEMAYMMQTARGIQPKVVCEIGADKGGGLYHWCKSVPSVERVIGCEIRGTPYAAYFEEAFPDIDFLWIPNSSYDQNVVDFVRDWLAQDKIDCLFIDGDKSYFDLDFWQYYPYINPQGIAFFHDIQDRPPRVSYDAVCARGFVHREYINLEDSKRAIENKKRGKPAANAHEAWLRYWKGRSAGVGTILLDGNTQEAPK